MPRRISSSLGVGVEHPVLEDGNVGVGALGDDAVPVEDRLLHTAAGGVLGSHDAGDQVERLDVAVVEPGIRRGDQFDGHVGVVEVVGADHHPQLAGHPLGVDVVAVVDAPGDLPVDEMGGALHLGQQLGEQSAQGLLFQGDVDVQGFGAGVEPVQVVLEQIHLAVGPHGGIVDAVPEEVDPVVEGHHQFVRCTDFSVIIRDGLHTKHSPLYTFPRPLPGLYAGGFCPSRPAGRGDAGHGAYTVTPKFCATMVRMTSTQVSSPRAALSRQRS